MDFIKSNFTYKELLEDNSVPIRVLKIFPSEEFSRIIECELHYTTLKGPSRIEYEAVSYFWGDVKDPANRGDMLLHGQKHTITKNLESALCHLRFQTQEWTLWVDALCINQSDFSERARQVVHMWEIYSPGGATQVLVWLGEEEDAKLALNECRLVVNGGRGYSQILQVGQAAVQFRYLCLQAVDLLLPSDFDKGHTQAEVRHTIQKLLHVPFCNKNSVVTDFEIWEVKMRAALKYISQFDHLPQDLIGKLHQRMNEMESCSRVYNACQNLFCERSWWSRSWIVQEVVHSGIVSVHIGALTPMCYDYLWECRNAFRQIKERLNRCSGGDNRHTTFEEFLGNVGTSNEAASLMFAFRNMKQADPEAFVDMPVAIFRFRHQKATDPRDKIYAFMALGRSDQQRKALLTPDYELPTRTLYAFIARVAYGNGLEYIVAAESETQEVETKQYIPTWVPNFCLPQDEIAHLKYFFAYCFRADLGFPSLPPHLQDEPRQSQDITDPTLVLRGICVGIITKITTRKSRGVTHGDSLTTLMQYTASGRLPRDHDGKHLPDDEVRTMFNTSWGPSQCMRGDIIIVSPGCSTPLILRHCGPECRSNRDPNVFHFVGGAWLIDSELEFKKDEKGNLKFEVEDNPGFSGLMYGAGCEGATNEDVVLYTLY